MKLALHRLGNAGLEAAEIGFGCMGLSSIHGTAEEAESIASIHRAILV